MRKLFVLILLMISHVHSAELTSKNGITPYGYNIQRLIELYEGGEYEKGQALTVFAHVFYSNAMAIEMIKQTNMANFQSFYCLSKAAKNPIKEIELFVAWSKISASRDSTILKDPITTLYPHYLSNMYPPQNCEKND